MVDIYSVSVDSQLRRELHRQRGRRRTSVRVRARPVRPGDRVKITRRVFERRFFLRPSPELADLIGYWLAVCLQAHGIKLHAAVFMSNHYHLDVTDTFGNLPAFKNHFNAVLARAVNAHRRRFDKFWSEDRPCDTRMLTDDDVLAGMVYTLVNPVQAGLVRRACRWPGFSTAGMRFGEQRSFQRPRHFFDSKHGHLPDVATLTLVRPDIRPELSDQALFALILERLHEREQSIARNLRHQHRRFLGESRVLRQRWNEAPTTPEDRFTARPTFSSRSKWARVAQVQRNRKWEQDYARARQAWLEGRRDVLFPEGTYWMRRFVGVPVHRGTGPP